MKKGIIVVLFIVVIYALSFLCCALLVKGLRWASGFTFTWKVAFGIWLLGVLIRTVFYKGGNQ